jgi:hypothetical protein
VKRAAIAAASPSSLKFSRVVASRGAAKALRAHAGCKFPSFRELMRPETSLFVDRHADEAHEIRAAVGRWRIERGASP